MPVELFLQDRRLPSLPEEALPGILALSSGMGLATQWDPLHTTLYVDSPLRGRNFVCMAEAAAPFGQLGQGIEADLIGRIKAAGGMGERTGRRLTAIRLHLAPAADDELALAVRHAWLPRSRRLGRTIARQLRSLTGWPVTVGGRWSLCAPQVSVHLAVPAAGAHGAVGELVAEGIWRGLMAHFSHRRRAAPVGYALPVPAPPVVAPPPLPPAATPWPPVPPLPAPAAHLPTLPPVPLVAARPALPGTEASLNLHLRRVVYRPLHSGVTESTPLYSWNWTIGASEWEVVRPQPSVGEQAATAEALPDVQALHDEFPYTAEPPAVAVGVPLEPVASYEAVQPEPVGSGLDLPDGGCCEPAEPEPLAEPTVACG